jgi:hypothetical protein
VGVRTCLRSLSIISLFRDPDSYEVLSGSLRIFYHTQSSIDRQEIQTRKITSKACKTSIGNQSEGNDPRWVSPIR